MVESRLFAFLVVQAIAVVANRELKVKTEHPRNGQKRIDVHASKWREAQNAINSLIDESISNEVAKAKMEVKALLDKNIAQHLHEASRKLLNGKTSTNFETKPTKDTYWVLDNAHHDATSGSDRCQDQLDNCAALATSGVCGTSREAMKKFCARTCDLCEDVEESFPPASPTHENTKSDRTWTIIGTDGKRFKTNFKNSESGMRKASITSAQVERLLEYVKQNAPHLKLVKIKPGVLKLVRLSTEQQTHEVTSKNDEAKSTKAAKGLQKKVELKSDRLPQGDYWTIKDHDKKVSNEKERKKTKGQMIHFDLTSISRDDKKDSKIKDGPLHSFDHKDLPKSQQSDEYLKHICHPLCKKTCISSCAPGCCAGEHHDFPLYHRKSTHCHPLCRKHCIPSCPLTCCTETKKVSKKWKHRHVHHPVNPSCHVMCKRNCVPSCPKACCVHQGPYGKSHSSLRKSQDYIRPATPKSHCHPLCKKTCLSSCPLSCCSERERIKEQCHPLCRKTCLPSCPAECCSDKSMKHKLITKSEETENKEIKDKQKSCPGLCPDSCAPACHSGCCSTEKTAIMKNKQIANTVPSGCTANCVYECIPGCPPACCSKSKPSQISSYDQPIRHSPTTATMFPYSQPVIMPYVQSSHIYTEFPEMYDEGSLLTDNSFQSANAYTARPTNTNLFGNQSPADYSLYAQKQCSSTCLRHCSPECARSDCCDVD